MRSSPARSLLATALLLPAAAMASPVAMAGGIEPGDVRFYLRMGDCGLSGSANVSATFQVIVKSASGERLLRQTVAANGSGTWHAGCIEGRFKGGESITARYLGGLVRLLVVPKLTVNVDRGANEARGVGPTSGPASVHLGMDACVAGSITCVGAVEVDVATDPATGAWLYPLGAYDADGADPVRLVWNSIHGDVLHWNQTTPYLVVQAGKAGVSGAGRSGVPLTVTLRSGSGVLRGTAKATPAFPYGGWTAVFHKAGRNVKVRVGDRINATFATDVSLRVRAHPITVAIGDARIDGTCRPNGEFGVQWFDDGALQGINGGTADAQGDWVQSAPGIDSGWTVRTWCGDAAGDVVGTVFRVP